MSAWVNIAGFALGFIIGYFAVIASFRWLEVKKFEKNMRLKQSQQSADNTETPKDREMFPNVPEELELEWTNTKESS